MLTDLEDGGLDARVLQQVHEQRTVKVGHAQVADETFVYEFL